jgi:Holliday junction DNA helicase RuvB
MPRPAPRFRDFIGQKQRVDFVRRQLAGAQVSNEPFPHSLFRGPSGVGKSLLARALAAEMGTDTIEAMGYDDRSVLGEKLGRLRNHDILLVDEAHRLGYSEQELLNEAIDDNSIPAPAPGPADGRVALPPWTLVLATDQPGRLLDALFKRVVLEVQLDYYPLDELKEIVAAMAGQPKINILLTAQAAKLVARVSGGLPRQAKQHLQMLRNFYPDAESREIGVAEVRGYLDARGFDEEGLSPSECRYLEVLARLGASSLESIALALGCDQRFVRREIESPLVRRGLVRIASSGRQLTAAGREWVGRRKPADSGHRCNEGPDHADESRSTAH